ncbi:MAG: radical SAM family heme chaperone HemW [Thermoanaerobaculia bacterium]
MAATNPLRADTGTERLGIYLHVPFCRTRCRYCDFYRVGMQDGRMAGFLAALHREIDGWGELHGRAVDTVFLGGGTPSLLTPPQLAEVLEHLRQRFRIAGDAEITAECNPSDLTPERLQGFRRAGINRLSLGVQSLQDRELRLIGRRHDARGAERAVRDARVAGFTNLSLDLILGLPGQTRAGFRATVERAIALAPEHLSVYILEIHAGQEVDLLRRRRPRLFPSEDEQADRYLWLVERLAAAGLERYEISNFARPSRESRHNLKYWRCQPCLGLGPAAHSLIGGRRFAHPRDLTAYVEDPARVEPVPSDPAQERLFLGLRLAGGLPVERLAGDLELPVPTLLSRCRDLRPYVEIDGGNVRLTARGALLSTSVLAELLDTRAVVHS